MLKKIDYDLLDIDLFPGFSLERVRQRLKKVLNISMPTMGPVNLPYHIKNVDQMKQNFPKS